VIELAGGERICLPQAFTVDPVVFDEAPQPAAPEQALPDGEVVSMAAVGARIREAREKARMTQSAIGNILGVSQTCISVWEAGRRDPGVTDLIRIAGAIGVLASSLLPPDTVSEEAQQPGRLARVEVKGFRNLGVVRVTDGTFAGEPMVHAERTQWSSSEMDGDAADFPASSLHFITWLPERLAAEAAQQPALEPAGECLCGMNEVCDVCRDEGGPF
jgi:DNA-binding XRE family transcriptional regulator